jgi:hypothetical protein
LVTYALATHTIKAVQVIDYKHNKNHIATEWEWTKFTS